MRTWTRRRTRTTTTREPRSVVGRLLCLDYGGLAACLTTRARGPRYLLSASATSSAARTPNARATFATLLSFGSRSPRSRSDTYVGCTRAAAASASWDRPAATRRRRTALPSRRAMGSLGTRWTLGGHRQPYYRQLSGMPMLPGVFGTIEIHAGDFKPGTGGQLAGKWLFLPVPGRFLREKIPVDELASVELASEESAKRLGGALGWGAAGAVLLGPLGLLAGLLAGGRSKKMTFVAVLTDERRFLGTTDPKTYNALLAAVF